MSVNGWIIVDKPAGMTSTRVDGLIKRLCKTKSLGHVGTLDPFATGLLPLAVGEATKVIPYVKTDIKEYEFDLKFGEARDTCDLEGVVIATSNHRPTAEAIQQALTVFRGQISQIPPIYSALRVNGERAYTLARQGIIPDLKARPVTIYELELLEFFSDIARLRVVCSTGTYVRTLGQDLSLYLGTVGHLTALRRTKVGKFTLTDSFPLDKLQEEAHITSISSCVLPIRIVLDDIPAISVGSKEELKIRRGQAIPFFVDLPESPCYLLLSEKGELSLAEKKDNQLFPIRVFNFSK
jgi:tRNA pseudouridine55 synthase